MPAKKLSIIEDQAHAAALLHPVRQRLLEELDEPRSAARLARSMKLPRQKVNYHLRELENAGFVKLVEERKKGNCIERLMVSTASAWIIDPTILGKLGQSPDQQRDRFSLSYLVSLAARAIGDLVRLRKAADRAGKRVPTLTLESEVRFANPKARKQFSEELSNCVASLVAKYHDESAEDGRAFHFMLAAWPKITRDLEADAETHEQGASDEQA